MSLGVVEVHVTYTKCPPLDITVMVIIIYLIFFFGDQNFFMATILQLKVAKRRLFEKVSLERWILRGINMRNLVGGPVEGHELLIELW